MKLIPLTQGKFAQVDDDDYEVLSKYKWYPQRHRNKWYVIRNEGKFPFRTTVKMHRQITGAAHGTGVDHWDGDGLNNQRRNLRVCTDSQNKSNTGKRAGNTSGFKGVYFHRQLGKWVAQIQRGYIKRNIGYFETAEDAARAYDEVAIEYQGEFAKLNFPR